jgi:hypothetical protein
MANYAVINDNKVINIIVCDSKEIAEQVTGTICIEYTNENPAGIGYTWDGSVFTKPIIEEITND